MVIVPVGPDVQMVAGSALWVRGLSAGRAQREAAAHAPAKPGDAFVVAGACYRFKRTAVAVVMDDRKRFDQKWAVASVRRAVELLPDNTPRSVMFPDWTADLMRQPRTQDNTLRLEAARCVAPLVVEAALAVANQVALVRLWIADADVAEVYRSELVRRLPSAQAVAA